MRRALVIVALVGIASGCSEVTAGSPLFTGRPLQIEERDDPALSLVFGSLRVGNSDAELDEIALTRVRPSPARTVLVSNAVAFRLFHARHLKHDLWVAPNLPPGVYQLAWVRSGLRTWSASGDRPVMRVEVTSGGVYDAGAWRVSEGELVPDPHPDQLSRFGEVLDAAQGTQWEEGVEQLRNRALSTNDR